MKRILVTGGAGFLGSCLCERLLSESDEVIWVDNFSTGSSQIIPQLLDHPQLKVTLEFGLKETITYSWKVLNG